MLWRGGGEMGAIPSPIRRVMLCMFSRKNMQNVRGYLYLLEDNSNALCVEKKGKFLTAPIRLKILGFNYNSEIDHP